MKALSSVCGVPRAAVRLRSGRGWKTRALRSAPGELLSARARSLRSALATSNPCSSFELWTRGASVRLVGPRPRGGAHAAAGAGEPLSAQVPKPRLYDGLERPIGASGSEWHPLFALIIFTTASFMRIQLDSFTLFQAFAIFTVVNSATSIFFDDAGFDKVGTVVAPAVLAVWAMAPSLDPGNVALSILGTYLSKELRVVPFWPTALSLAAALYLGIGNEWVTSAYALLNVAGLFKATQSDGGVSQNKPALLAVPVLAVTGFVLLKGISPLWAVSLGLGEVVRSTYGLLDRLRRERA